MYMLNPPEASGGAFRVLIVDDHPLYGDALQSALELGFEGSEFRRAQTLAETLDVLSDGFEPTLIVFDLRLPDVTGMSGFRKLKAHSDTAHVLVVSSLASTELVHSLIEAGADGFLPKDAPSETLNSAIAGILNGGRYIPSQFVHNPEPVSDIHAFETNPELSALTGQQMRILSLICAGKPNKQIAYELSLAEATVKAHITALLRRLGVQNRTQAVVVAESALMRYGNGAPEAQAYLSH
ncbi:MAG: response regulator transcription factor [Pseudomonadota bacterium]